MNTHSKAAHYGDDQRPQFLAGMTICIIIIASFVSTRLYAQYLIKQLWQPDNWLAVAAALCAVAVDATCIASVRNGLGLHTYRVLKEDPDPPASLIRYSQTGYAISVITNLAVMFVKLSILSFYHRIFTARKRIFKYSLMIVGTYVILVGVGSTIEFIFQCRPISYFWVGRSYLAAGIEPPNPKSGWCMPQVLHLAIPLLAGLVSDIIILLLPALGLWDLQLAREKKLGVYFALSLGVFACAIEIVRIYFCFQTNNRSGADITWTNAGSLIWSGVEPSVAVVCACIPATAPLLKRMRKGGVRTQSQRPDQSPQTKLRPRFYSASHNAKGPVDNESLKGLKEGSGWTNTLRNVDLARDDQYSYTIAHDCMLSNNEGARSDIPLHAIQVSKQLDISHAPSAIHKAV